MASSLALSMLAIDSRPRMRRAGTANDINAIQRSTVVTTPAACLGGLDNSAARRGHSSRKATSHFNQFQTSCMPSDDAPPAYASVRRISSGSRNNQNHVEALPSYTCTVEAQAKVLLKIESENPLCDVVDGEWKEVIVVLQGTLLSFHRAKDDRPGKLLRSYTLQHAEVGLASDAQHAILVPKSRIAHFIPTAARRKAWRTDPDLFNAVRQTILRLRVETDQILLAHSDEKIIHSLINRLATAIDISPAIDERSIPRQCTVPRRRRRNRHTQSRLDNLQDPSLLAEQERILRHDFPTFANRAAGPTAADEADNSNRQASPLSTPIREEDDLDLAVMQEETEMPTHAQQASATASSDSDDSALRPAHARRTTTTSLGSSIDGQMMYATSAANINAAGKWQPPHNRSASQAERYIRRCMPVLAGDAPRASDIIICAGRRAKINWRMEVLEDWELQPPSYKAHRFDTDKIGAALTRTKSQSSASVSATSEEIVSTPMETPSDEAGNIGFGLAKFASAASTTKVPSPTLAISSGLAKKVRHTDRPYDPNMNGVVFCF